MSERIFETNGLYVTSVASPLGAGPVLEFDTAGQNPRLDEDEAYQLIVAIGEWISK